MSLSEEKKERMDKAHSIKYPVSADARGSTRVNYKRRPYYLGPFESPQSFIMFGLWKHRLLEDGRPPETRELRKLVDDLLHSKEDRAENERWFKALPYFAASFIGLTFGIAFAWMFFSTFATPLVDGRALTDEEVRYVRGMRGGLNLIDTHQDVPPGHIAVLTAELMEEGPSNGLRHQRSEDF